DGRSDIWGLGNVLFWLLTGRAPFAGSSSAATLAKIIADPVPPLCAERPDVPPELECVVVRCLEKAPEQRFQRVEDLASALSAALAPRAASAPDPVPFPRADAGIEERTVRLLVPAPAVLAPAVPVEDNPVPASPGPVGGYPPAAGPMGG